MTQEQVAEKMNVDRSTVRRWEKGDKIPGYDESKKLSQLYNMPLDYIFFGKRSRF
ncbi:XRE family transcriptional regulator [Roseburia sp. AM59-24XD]|nr:XRE family transcriptional regulator [Roseburia sp. AM59-24XD]